MGIQLRILIKKYANYFLLISALSSFLLGCCCAAPVGLRKTQLTDWRRKTFSATGLSIDLPMRALGFGGGYHCQENASKLGYTYIRIRLHPIFMGSYMLEPFYLIDIVLARMPADKYTLFKTGELFLVAYDQFQETNEVFFNELTESRTTIADLGGREQEIYTVIRKDYLAPNGDYVVAGGLIYSGSKKYIPPEFSDRSAVKRILGSVEFLAEEKSP